MNLLKLFILLFVLVNFISADQIATTEDGKKVILLDNGSWRYLKENETVKKTPTQRISLIEIIKRDQRFDFRKVRWGMSKKEVIASENAELIKNEDNVIEYTVEFLGYNCTVAYTFFNDALTKAAFFIRQSHVDPALYYNDYDNLKKYLSPSYGAPVSDQCDWKNEMYRHDKSKWGFAVSLGFLTCRTQWHNDRTQITLAISGSNHQIMTNLEYTALMKR